MKVDWGEIYGGLSNVNTGDELVHFNGYIILQDA